MRFCPDTIGEALIVASDSPPHLEALVLWVSDKRLRVFFSGQSHDIGMPGKWRQHAHGLRPVAPGDLLSVALKNSELRALDVLPRRNEFTRKIAGTRSAPQTSAANLDLALVIASAARPATPFGLVDRLLVTASIGNVPARLVLNKSDLADQDLRLKWQQNYRAAVDRIIFSSSLTSEGVDQVHDAIRDKITLLAGSSGVGKSSLVNLISPGLDIRTGPVSVTTGKGRHITSSALLHPLSGGGWIIDTPGLRECAPWGLNGENLVEAFPEIAAQAESCRFSNCRHVGETGCRVDEEVQNGNIPQERYASYRKLLSEIPAVRW